MPYKFPQQQYQSMFVPMDLGVIQQNLAQRQQRYDATSTALAQAKAGLYDMDTYDPTQKAAMIKMVEDRFGDIYSRHSGDLGAAATDVIDTIADIRSHPYFSLNKAALEKVKQRDALKQQYGAEMWDFSPLPQGLSQDGQWRKQEDFVVDIERDLKWDDEVAQKWNQVLQQVSREGPLKPGPFGTLQSTTVFGVGTANQLKSKFGNVLEEYKGTPAYRQQMRVYQELEGLTKDEASKKVEDFVRNIGAARVAPESYKTDYRSPPTSRDGDVDGTDPRGIGWRETTTNVFENLPTTYSKLSNVKPGDPGYGMKQIVSNQLFDESALPNYTNIAKSIGGVINKLRDKFKVFVDLKEFPNINKVMKGVASGNVSAIDRDQLMIEVDNILWPDSKRNSPEASKYLDDLSGDPDILMGQPAERLARWVHWGIDKVVDPTSVRGQIGQALSGLDKTLSDNYDKLLLEKGTSVNAQGYSIDLLTSPNVTAARSLQAALDQTFSTMPASDFTVEGVTPEVPITDMKSKSIIVGPDNKMYVLANVTYGRDKDKETVDDQLIAITNPNRIRQINQASGGRFTDSLANIFKVDNKTKQLIEPTTGETVELKPGYGVTEVQTDIGKYYTVSRTVGGVSKPLTIGEMQGISKAQFESEIRKTAKSNGWTDEQLKSSLDKYDQPAVFPNTYMVFEMFGQKE